MSDNKFFINLPIHIPQHLFVIKNIILALGTVFPENQTTYEKNTDYISNSEIISARLNLGLFQISFHFGINLNTEVISFRAVFSKELETPILLDCSDLNPDSQDDWVGWLSVIRDLYTQLTAITIGTPTETYKLSTKGKNSIYWVLLGKIYEVYRYAGIIRIRQLYSKEHWNVLQSADDIDKCGFMKREGLTFKILTKEPISLGATNFPNNSILEFSNGYTYYKEHLLGIWKYVLEQDVENLQQLIDSGKVLKIE